MRLKNNWRLDNFYKKRTRKRFNYHCVKNIRIRSFSGPHFPTFGLNTERYGGHFEVIAWKWPQFPYLLTECFFKLAKSMPGSVDQELESKLAININRSSRPEVFLQNMFLKSSQNSQENTCFRVSFLINCRPQISGLQLH